MIENTRIMKAINPVSINALTVETIQVYLVCIVRQTSLCVN